MFESGTLACQSAQYKTKKHGISEGSMDVLLHRKEFTTNKGNMLNRRRIVCIQDSSYGDLEYVVLVNCLFV